MQNTNKIRLQKGQRSENNADLLINPDNKSNNMINLLVKTLSLPVNVAYICVYEIVVHVIKFIQWYTTAIQEENKSETICTISDQESANMNQLKVTVQSPIRK